MNTHHHHSVSPSFLSVNPANSQHIGQRDSQQDAFGFTSMADIDFARHAGYLGVLADGMGGLENGSWASSQAVRTFLDLYKGKNALESPNDALLRAALGANDVIHAEADRLKLVDRMGTTLVAAVIRERDLFWLNIGDSRVYLYNAGQMLQLSTDHNFSVVLNDQLVRGEIALSEVKNHPMRNALTSYLGRREPPSIDRSTGSIKLQAGAWVLLCSDGLSGVLSECEISAELYGAPQAASERLVQAAISRGMPDQDNTTVILMQVPETGQLVNSGQATTRPNYDLEKFAQSHAPRKLTSWIAGIASAMAIALVVFGLVNFKQPETVVLAKNVGEVPILVSVDKPMTPGIPPEEFIPTALPFVGNDKIISASQAKSTAKQLTKLEPKRKSKSETKPETRPETKPESKTDPKSEAKPKSKDEATAEANQSTPKSE